MNVEDYVKLRCALNNRNYVEVKEYYESTVENFKVEKYVLDEFGNVKYCVKYTVKDYGDISKQDFRYTASVSATFFIQRKDLKSLDIKTNIDGYDSLSMYYHFCFYQEPSVIEETFEKIWDNFNNFSVNPFLNSKKNT